MSINLDLPFPPRTELDDLREEVRRLRSEKEGDRAFVAEMFLVLGSVAELDETMVQTARRLVWAELRRQKPSWMPAPAGDIRG